MQKDQDRSMYLQKWLPVSLVYMLKNKEGKCEGEMTSGNGQDE